VKVLSYSYLAHPEGKLHSMKSKPEVRKREEGRKLTSFFFYLILLEFKGIKDAGGEAIINLHIYKE